MPSRITKGLSGVAGEYLVAGELSRRGFIASITLRNTRGIDILVTNDDASKSAGIQVKTNQNSAPKWVLNEKVERLASPTLFYVFVNLNGLEEQPTYYVVPSRVVSDYCRESHAIWLSTPGRSGQQRNDSSMRNFSDKEGKYRDAWHLLGLG